MNCTALKELLEEFVTKNFAETDYPKELDELLADTARTGVVRFSWNLLKPLLKFRLESVFKSESLSIQSDKDKEDAELSQHLLKRLDLFDNPPFTIQRVCELVMNPRQHYKRRDKYMRAMEKNLMVVGTQEPDLTWMKSPRLTQLLEEKTSQLSNHTNSTTTNAVEHPSQSHLDTSPKEAAVDRPLSSSPSEDQKEGLDRVLQEADSTTLDHGSSPDKGTVSKSAEETSRSSDGQNKSEKMECESVQGAAEGASEGDVCGRPVQHGDEVAEGRPRECSMDAGGSVAVLETGQYVTGMDEQSTAPGNASGDTGGVAPASSEPRAVGDVSDTERRMMGGANSESKEEETGEQSANNASVSSNSKNISQVEEKTDANGNVSVTFESGRSDSQASAMEEPMMRKDEVSMETGEASSYESTTEEEAVRAGNAGSIGESDYLKVGGACDVEEGGATLKVADEGEWVVVELGCVADKSTDGGTSSAGESEDNGATRQAKRPRSGSESEVEDKKDDAEPVAKQCRLEDKEEAGVAGEMSEEGPRVLSDPEVRAEEMDSTEEPESSYKEEATGQVEKVEGEDTTTNGN